MPFNLLTVELQVSEEKLTTKHSQETADKLHSLVQIVSHAQIEKENFSLLVLLTSDAHLLVRSKVGLSSQSFSVPIEKFFAENEEILSHLAVVTITADLSLIVCVSNDGPTIFLIPFCAFMDASWGRMPTPSMRQPMIFSLFGFGSAVFESSPLVVCAAICFQSSAGHMYLVFGDLKGSLFLVNLDLRRIDAKFDLSSGICSLHSFAETDGKRLLLVSLSDRTQVILPLQGSHISLRETLIRITPSKIHQLDKKMYIFSQFNESVCVMDSSKKQLALFDSLFSIWSMPPRLCLDCFETADVCQVICMPRMIGVLTLRNDLFIHLRFSEIKGTSLCYAPMRVILPSEVSACKMLHLVSSTISTDKSAEGPLECFAALTEKDCFALQTQKPFNDLIIAHLNSQFFSANFLSSVAVSLQISPAELCLSLLRHSLRNFSDFPSAHIDGIISLAFKIKIESNEILSVLHENSRCQLLLPFLRIKIERDPGDESLRQLFLKAILGRIAQIAEEKAKNGEENEPSKTLEAEKDSLERELRHFLVKFRMDQSDLLLFCLRLSLFSCVCVLLCRNATVHSPTVASFLLELSDWNATGKVGNLLKCLSLIHWPSVDSNSPTIVPKLFSLVPFATVVQLKLVNRIAKLLVERSIESAHSLQLFCSLRLFHLNMQSNAHSDLALKMHKNCVDSGSNCTVLIAEDVCEIDDNVELHPFFWGEFSAGTQRLLRNERAKSHRQSVVGSAISSPEVSGENAITSYVSDTVSSTNMQRPADKQRMNSFSPCLFPKAVKLANSDLAFCAVACGTEHVLLLTVDGRLFSWGLNRFGQCGNGTEQPIHAPIEIVGKWSRIVSICAGHYHSGFISENDELYLWGWGLHGQLGNGQISNLKRPSKIRQFTSLGNVKNFCLGYSHSLALFADGRVFGSGALSHGQLGINPRHLKGCPTKALTPVQLPFPTPISLIASKYFHGVALGVERSGKNVLFQWGDSPQALKMNAFLKKRLRLKQKNNLKLDGHESPTETEREAQGAVAATDDLQPIHLSIRKICEWDGASVKALSAGFNHSALLTSDGHLFTWGKSLEMQLGHRNRRERAQPTKVEIFESVRWSEVVCARNFTTATSVEGKVFVWGRNDKFQLGLGKTTEKGTAGRIRTISLKPGKENVQRSLELPVDNCIEMPTIVHGLRAFVENETQTIPDEKRLSEMISSADQLSLDTLSRFLLNFPLPHHLAVQVHLMSGDLLAALRLLFSLIKSKNAVSVDSESPSPSGWPERPVTFIARANVPKELPVPCPSFGSSSLSSSASKRMVAVKLRGTFCSSSEFPSAAEHLPMRCLDSLHALVDKLWALLRVHPIREVQTCALIELLHHRFPIYNRLAMDSGLCRLVDPFLTISDPYESLTSSSFCAPLPPRTRLTEISIRQRAAHLRKAKVTDPHKNSLFRALKERCDKLLAQKNWRFFSACGHFEAIGRSEGTQSEAKRTHCAKCAGTTGRSERSRRKERVE